ncbi:hypothetical protein PENSUB_9195 [Penicillium subrubescens]|uniref:NAD(P)-binding domain-containing protein n=1 Tax=Penicillium subrubescens TaxID=1316194 RepID=A0A1Q5TE91_9EURO|nr:hypothetical protein PENSUB_9195 [Penicillium subrubescens]
MFQVKQSPPAPSDGLVGIHHELVNHWCALEDGGSIVAEFSRHKGGLLETAKIHAAVRSDEQAESLSMLDVSVVKIDLSNPYALAGYMIRNDVSIVIHTATSIDAEVTQNLITALKKRREANGKKAFFIHEVVLTHISDLTTFYAQLTEAILQKRALPACQSGYYFTVSHSVRWWDILDRLAAAMHARVLVDEPTTKIWPSDAFAAESLGVPVNFAHSIWDSSPKVVCVNKDLIGWKPIWNSERLLESMDEEINDFLELGMPTSSLLASLGPEARR